MNELIQISVVSDPETGALIVQDQDGRQFDGLQTFTIECDPAGIDRVGLRLTLDVSDPAKVRVVSLLSTPQQITGAEPE